MAYSQNKSIRRENRQFHPSLDNLEDRQLLSTIATGQSSAQLAQRAEHKLHQYVSKLQEIELESRATPAEFLALRDDARTISAEASTQPRNAPGAAQLALAITRELDRAPLEGWLGDPGWSAVHAAVQSDLQGLSVDQSTIDKTFADIQAVAISAGVTYGDYKSLTLALDSYQDARLSARNTYVSLPDPQTYYTQHLRGFFRGLAAGRNEAANTLQSDALGFTASSHANPAQVAVMNRDVKLLKNLTASSTSTAAAAFNSAYVAAFEQGAPSAETQAQLRATAQTAFGPSPTPAQVAAIDQLITDTPSLFEALNASQANVGTLVNDVQSVVDNGADAALNPFKIRVP
jgi:hypothetical protein